MPKNIKIAIVDDSEVILAGTARILKSAGYQVFTAASGSKGLEMVRAAKPELVLLDVVLPDIDGIEVCKAIKRDPIIKSVFVVLMSGKHIHSEDQAGGLEAGADGYIARPISNRELLARIQAFERIIVTEKERDRLIDQLRNSEKDLSIAQKMAQIGSWKYIPKTEKLIWSDELFRIHGLDPRVDRISLAKTIKMVHPDDKAYAEGTFKTALKGGSPYEMAYRIITPNGEERVVQGTGDPEKDETGAVVSIYGTGQDITDRQRSERALIESEAKYRQMVEHINDVIFSIDDKGYLTFISPAVKTVMGYEPSEIIGKNFVDYIHKDDLDHVLEKLQKVLSGELEPSDYRVRTKSGAYHWVRSSSRPIYEGKRLVGLQGVFADISESKRLEEQLRQAYKLEAIGTLAGGIAHDFNNILASILGFTELALDDAQSGSNLEDNLQEVYAAGTRAKELVTQILTFARQSEYNPKPIQVDLITREVLKLLRPTIPTTIEIRQKLNSDSLMMADPTQIHQIVMNLCANAAQAMEDAGGMLKVSLKDVHIGKEAQLHKQGLDIGDYIKLKISDTGVGIHPDIIGSIFDPYFTTREPGQGTGMGLSLVHSIIESVNGKITVKSKPGEGSVFKAYLPIVKKRNTSNQYQHEPALVGTERILFIDDEAPIAKMGAQILDRLGYQVAIRTSSVEALELFRSKPNEFDLVISDMTMPNLTGDKLALELMQIRPDIPVILCTGYSKRMSEATAVDMGIKAFVFKPIVKSELAKTIRKVLDQ